MPPHRSRGLLTWVAFLSVAAALVVPLPAAAQPVEVVPEFVQFDSFLFFFGGGEFAVTSLVEDREVVAFEIGPKGKSVFYRADQQEAGVFEVYRGEVKSGAVTWVSAPLVAGGSVHDFEISR